MNEKSKLDKTKSIYIDYRNLIINSNYSLEHYHDSYELVYFDNADLKIFIKDKCYDIKNKVILIVNPYEIHKIVYSNNKSYKRYMIHFKEEYIFDLLKTLKLQDLLIKTSILRTRSTYVNIKRQPEIENKMKHILGLYNRFLKDKNLLNDAYLKTSIIQVMVMYYNMLKSGMLLTVNTSAQKQVQEIIKYIDENYMGKITLDILENAMHLNKYYISHIFKNTTGFNLIEYVQHRRVIEAQKMLADAFNSITDICYYCGFNSIQHFHRVFKSIAGTTPLKYRKSI